MYTNIINKIASFFYYVIITLGDRAIDKNQFVPDGVARLVISAKCVA